jgi:hypothetical protein
MAIALIQNPFVNGAGTLTAFPITLTQATGSGNLLVVAITYFPNTVASITSVTDNATGGSNTYTQVPSAYAHIAAGSNGSSDLWYCANCKSGATTVTINFSVTVTFEQGGVLEYSGAALSSPVDVSNNVSNGSAAATTFTGPTLATTNPGDVVVAVCNPFNTVTAVTAPFTSRGNVNNAAADSDYIPGATGSYTPTFTGTTGGFCISAAAFLPAASGGTTMRTMTRVGM